jgi:hypothetical protein
MREAFLTGDADAPETEAVSTTPLYWFESVTLTEDGHLKLTGSRFAEGASDEFTITRSRAPHPDLLKELRRLTLHLVLLTEHISEAQLYPTSAFNLLPPAIVSRNLLRDAVETGEAFVHPLLEPFRCLSVAWKPKGVVLSGTKKTRYRFGKDLEIKTPLTLVMSALDDEAADDDYAFFEPMSNTLAALVGECIAYMNGKYGEGGEQLDLFGKDAPAPTLSEAINIMDKALDASVSRRNAALKEVGSDLFSPASVRAHQADEAAHIEQLQQDAAGDESTGLGTIHNPNTVRPAKRKAVKGEASHD